MCISPERHFVNGFLAAFLTLNELPEVWTCQWFKLDFTHDGCAQVNGALAFSFFNCGRSVISALARILGILLYLIIPVAVFSL